jgi:hypothetical protein
MGVGHCRTQDKNTIRLSDSPNITLLHPQRLVPAVIHQYLEPVSVMLEGQTCPLMMTVPDSTANSPADVWNSKHLQFFAAACPHPPAVCPHTPCRTDHSHPSIVKIKQLQLLG